MLADLLIVVDMLRGFLEEGRPLDCGQTARDIIPFVRDRVAAYDRAGKPLLFLADNHAPDDAEFNRFPPHCVKGTEEAQIIPELADWALPERVIPKTRYSGFFDTDLEQRIERIGLSSVEVVGVCTNICVLYTVEELRNRDIETVVPRRGVASFDRAAHEFALDQMQSVLAANVT
jgi:nicotinamidase/pyrazinamidase